VSEAPPVVETVDRPTPPPGATIQPVMRSPVHHQHEKLGARFRREGAFELPSGYSDLAAERRALIEGLAIADVTARAKVDLRGEVDAMLTRLPQAPDLHRARLSARWALLLGGPSSGDAYLEAAEAAASGSGMATDATSIYAGFALAGPLVVDLLSRLTSFDVASLTPGAAVGTQLAKISAILLSSPAPFRGYEILVPSEYGRYAWESFFKVGHALGARPVGWDALRAEGWS
jgi:glycine cleavage system aminomethyltransferase T